MGSRITREPTWATEFCKDRLGKEGPKDRLEMLSREPTWAKKVQEWELKMVSREPMGIEVAQG